jgi:hypothetical protein
MVHIQARGLANEPCTRQTRNGKERKAKGREGKERKGREGQRKEGKKDGRHGINAIAEQRHRRTSNGIFSSGCCRLGTQILWLISGWQRLKKRGNNKAPLGSVIMRSTGEQQQRRSRGSSRSRSSRSRRLLMLRLRLRLRRK